MGSPMKSLEYHLTRLARKHILTVLEKVFRIPPRKVRIRITWKNPLGGRWKSEGMVLPVRRGEYIIGINPRCAQSESHFKGTCAHEAIHVAIMYFKDMGKEEEFWKRLADYIPSAVEYLWKYYGNTEEFLVGVLEPLVTLVLVPPADASGWSLAIIEPPPEPENPKD